MEPITLLRFYEDLYRPDKHARPKQAKTVEQYRTDLRVFNKAFRFRLAETGERLRDVCVSDLSDELLKYAMKWQLDRGRSEATANRLYRTICALWRDAFARELLPTPPRTKPFREPRRESECWSLEEFQLLLGAAEMTDGWVGATLARHFWTAYLWFTYASGARQAVTLALPTEAFDEKRGEVLLPAELQKQDADQLVELLPQAVTAIARLRSRERGLRRLFGDWDASITAFNRRLKRIIVAAGLRESVEKVTRRDLSHKIRRTFATHACANSDEETVRKLLGHSHVSVTRRYLDKRYLPGVSAKHVVPPLPSSGDPKPPHDPNGRPSVRIWRPEAI